LNLFRGESALGGAFPPSATDKPDDRRVIANPTGESDSDQVRITGAQLLAHALMGADGLGTPGFRDFDRDGTWWDDTHRGPPGNDEPAGAYHIYDQAPNEGQEAHARYGGAGYVDEKMKEQAKSFTDLEDKNVILNLDRAPDDFASEEKLFVDPWDTPILYYRANPATLRMTYDPATERPGIYWQDDNAIITGTDADASGRSFEGFDFGPGKVNERYHELYLSISPDATEDPNKILTTQPYEGSFARFILDPKIQARPTPVQKDSYLLISPGPDARYGTEDDVTNWTRGQ
jgi:hypothetical protein